MRALTSPPRKSRAPRASRAFFKRAVYRVKGLQRNADRRRHILRVRLRILQIAPRLIVGQARMRDDHRFVESRLAGFTGFADMHVADKGQAFDARHQRTQSVGQIFRQHRYDAIRKIHRRGARSRLAIQRAANAHVMADVGDGDDQPPAAAVDGLGVHRVVEILSIRAVDGHQRQSAQILAARMVRRRSRPEQIASPLR